MKTDLQKHETECALRYEGFKEQFKIASDRVTRVEMAVYALYPFMVTLVLTVSYLK
jgi:hypothetical protein|tara:strand:- start:7537 stop:7704 length:168 start_codon:yes stop_codon:yes gene_type:complete